MKQEKYGLTELEKEIDAIIREYIKRNIELKCEVRNILNLVEKELKNNNWRQSLRFYKDAYEQGKQDALKDLPKVETVIVNDWQYGKDQDHTIIPAIHQRIEGFNVGDKVKIIIVKEV